MQSNINLLNDLPSKATAKYLSISFLQQVCLGFAVLLIIIYLINVRLYFTVKSNWTKATNTYLTTTKQLNQVKEQITYAKSIMPTTAPSINMPSSSNFSTYLKKLALYTPYGVWLTSINFNEKNNLFVVTGQAAQSLAVLDFTKAISQYNIFNNQGLSNIHILQENKGNTVSFSLSNTDNKSQ